MLRRRGRIQAGAVVVAALVLTACSDAPDPSAGATSTTTRPPSVSPTATTSRPTPTVTPTPTPTPTSPVDPLAGWSLEQRVGQLFMVGVNVAEPQQVSYDAISQYHVGNLFLAGRTHAGTERVRNLVDSFTELVSPDTTHGTALFVATDQEGGQVQVLQGPGFSTMPSALDQADVDPAELEDDAAGWGAELAAAGVDVNLAPVTDLVPSAEDAATNPPIGEFQRNYGYTLDDVTSHANAFSAGMESAGVAVAIKHFPGLGRVTQNTDTDADVTDTVTTPDDPSVQAFASGIDAGAAFVMTATAVYTLIDPDHPAAFSPVVIDLLRHDLGFGGVVITDDVSGARQVQAWSPGDRAVLTIDAGGDMVLASADPSVIGEMVTAVVDKARSDPAFAQKVDAAVSRVLATKARLLR